MARRIRFGLAAAGLLAFALGTANLARAQRMAPGGARPSAAPVRARPAGMHVAVVRSRAGQNTNATATAAPSDVFSNGFGFGGTFLSLQDLLNPAPTPGFDFAHLAAINRDLGIKAVIDPATEWQLAIAERLLQDERGLFTPGFFLLDGGGEFVVPAEAAPTQQPPVIVLQQAPSAAQPSAPAAAAPAPEAAPPLRDVGQFTLALKNGKKIQAVAFMRSNDRIIYITADGTRHMIAVSDIDIDATRQINEERGTPLQLSL